MSSWTKTISPKSMASGMSVLKKYAKTQYGLDEQEDKASRSFTDYLKHLYEKWGIKYFVLLLLLACYASLGGLVFMFLERQPERDELNEIAAANLKRRREFAANITVRLAISVLPSQSCNDFCEEKMKSEIEKLLLEYDNATGISATEEEPNYSWNNFWTSSFYAVTLFTTIGYGNMSCRTKLGKAATILYSLIGIPIMLMVLDHWGKLMFRKVRECWFWFLRKIRAQARRFMAMSSSNQPEEDSTVAGDEELVNQIEDTVPLSLALLVVVFYTFFCAAFFKLWETEWSYFEAFYFFFISLSTIGLGDQVPEHPKYALAAFILFVIGLSFVSMCASVMGARIEAQYMAALMMVEQQAAEAVEQERAELTASLESPSSPFRLNLPSEDTEQQKSAPEFDYASKQPQHSPSPAALSTGHVPRRSPSLISHMMIAQRQSTTSSGSEHGLPATLGVIRSSMRAQTPHTRVTSRYSSSVRYSSNDQSSLPRSPFRRTAPPGSALTPTETGATVPMVTVEETDEAPKNTRL